MRAVAVALELVDDVDDGLLEEARDAVDRKIVLQLHILGHLGFQLARHGIEPFLRGDDLQDVVEIIGPVAHIHAQHHIGGEVAERAAPEDAPQVHGHVDFEHRAASDRVLAADLLQGGHHGGGEQFGHRSLPGPGHFRGAPHRDADTKIAQVLGPQRHSLDMPGRVVLLQGAAFAVEGVESVRQLGGAGRIGGIQDAAAIDRLRAMAQAEVFRGQREQEGHAAVAVGQDVEDIENDAAAVRRDAEQEAAVALDAEMVQRLERKDAGRLVQMAQIPPERTARQGIMEGRDAGNRRLQRLLEHVDGDRLGKGDGHPVQRRILLRLAGGIYERGVVEPQQVLQCHAKSWLCFDAKVCLYARATKTISPKGSNM